MFIPYVLAMLCAGIAFASTDWTEPLKSGELFNKSKAETDKLYLTRLTTYSVDDHTIRLAAGAVTIGELKFGEVLVYRNAEGGDILPSHHGIQQRRRRFHRQGLI